jgi:hypothetical protein
LPFALLLAGRAEAQTTINPLGSDRRFRFTGPRTTVLGNSIVGDVDALQEISWTEYTDQPCLLKITVGSFNGGQSSFRPEMDICDRSESLPTDPCPTSYTPAEMTPVQTPPN